MARIRTPPVSYPLRDPPNAEARREVRVVAMRGDYDLSNIDSLCKMLSAAIAVDDADLVIDASEVTFLGAATLNVLIRARIFLSDYRRSLIVRSPSPCVRRIFDICGLDELIETTDARRVAPDQVAVGALEPSVTVPSTTRPGWSPPSVTTPRRGCTRR